MQIELYLNVKPDGTSDPLPTIRLSVAPTNGKVAVKRANVKATNYKKCLALEVPGFVAFYRSNAGYVGIDKLTLEVNSPTVAPKCRTSRLRLEMHLPTSSKSDRIWMIYWAISPRLFS